MRQHLATVLLGTSLGGCSLLYNPSNIPSATDAMPDQMIDAPIDGDPAMLMLTAAQPSVIFEGQGTGGSRPAVLVIQGVNIVKANTVVTVAPSAGSAKTPNVMVDNAHLDVSADSAYLAVPVTIAVDDAVGGLGAADQIKLDITVAQDGPGGRITKTLTQAVTVQGLGELEGAAPAGVASGDLVYALVNITSGTLKANAGVTSPITIHSMGALSIGAFDVSGNGTAGGPGAGHGGQGGSVLGANTPGTGPAAGQSSGAPGGFTTDNTVYTLDDPFRGSGGAGTITTLGGGDGGGGGGSIMLTADGNLTVGAGSALGGVPTGSGTSAGGGGSGGVIVLRAGNNLTGGAQSASGTMAGSGSQGANGKIRYDAAGTVTLPGAAGFYRGPTFVGAPLIATSERPALMVAGTRSTPFKYFIKNATGAMINGPFSGNIPDVGTAAVTFGSSATDKLFPGLNHVCLVAGAGDASSPTRSCIDIANTSHP